MTCNNFVAGKFIQGSGPAQSVVNPQTGTVIGEFHQSSASDVNAAIATAKKASQTWRKTPIKERATLLLQLRNILIRDLEAISKQVAAESGKTFNEARAGLLKGIEVLEFATALQNSDQGGRVQVSRGVFCEYRREALGVVAGITPFNFPAMVPMWMIPIALACGNAFVWKPSDKVPLTSNLLAKAIQEAGFPDGVFTVVQGGRETVEAILDHSDIAAVGFVGSSPIAKSVYARGTTHGKRVLALGGAKNPIILMPDADLAMSAQGIADSFTGCAGQRCMAASVLLAVSDQAGNTEKLIAGIVERAKKIRPGMEMGALISKASLDKLSIAIEQAVKEGAKLLLDGRNPLVSAEQKNGFWLGPTILDQVAPNSTAACTELFGPIISIVRCKNLSEALAFEASSDYGNACSVFTQNGAIAERVANESTAGMIGVNIGVPVPREPFSFGGTKTSKFGSGDITGNSGVEFWSQLKKVTVKWAENPDKSDKNWMS
jgi:malonate-semialdehyde dehydrogenase (acetylating)/methylmalonate-semialdehyde dehydrogenase